MRKFALNFLLQFIPRDTGTFLRFAQSLLIAPFAIELYQLCKTPSLGFSRDEFFYEGDINSHAVGDAAGANLVGMIFGHNMNLLLSRIGTFTGVTVRWRGGAGIAVRIIGAHAQLIAVHSSKAKRDNALQRIGHK